MAGPGGEDCFDWHFNGIARAEAEKELLAAGTAHARTECTLRRVRGKSRGHNHIGENVCDIDVSFRLEEGCKDVYSPIFAAREYKGRSRATRLDAEHVDYGEATVDLAIRVFRTVFMFEKLEDVT